jgi:hypothetical protein
MIKKMGSVNLIARRCTSKENGKIVRRKEKVEYLIKLKNIFMKVILSMI